MADFNPGEMAAIIFLSGFAIQQTLQILDSLGIQQLINWMTNPTTGKVWGVDPKDFKKSLMLLFASTLGVIVAFTVKVKLLSLVPHLEADEKWDMFVSGLVIGSGTEAANILLKYFGYLKDAQKDIEIEVTITPPSPKVVVGKRIRLTARVKNGDSSAVEWSVIHEDGGKIDKDTGEYTAPNTTGEFQVLVTSKQDRDKMATVTVTVTKPPA